MKALIVKSFFLIAILFSANQVSAQYVQLDDALIILDSEIQTLDTQMNPVINGQSSADEAFLVARSKKAYFAQLRQAIVNGDDIGEAIIENLPKGLPTVGASGWARFDESKTELDVLKNETIDLLSL